MAKILIAGAGGAPSEGVIYSLKKILTMKSLEWVQSQRI